jgi:hypothetical protein
MVAEAPAIGKADVTRATLLLLAAFIDGTEGNP